MCILIGGSDRFQSFNIILVWWIFIYNLVNFWFQWNCKNQPQRRPKELSLMKMYNISVSYWVYFYPKITSDEAWPVLSLRWLQSMLLSDSILTFNCFLKIFLLCMIFTKLIMSTYCPRFLLVDFQHRIWRLQIWQPKQFFWLGSF